MVGAALRTQSDDTLGAACLRVGLMMAILWFAQPQLRNFPRWLVTTIVVVLLIAMRWPKFLLLALPVIAVMWLLRPRGPRATRPIAPRGAKSG